MAYPNTLIPQLQTLLQDLIDNPYPTLPNPEGLQKRASVALIIRLNPSYSHWTLPSEKPSSLSELFAQDWTRYANPEVLFIKRSARKGDRWTSHIALPGGKLDPSDPSDSAAAIRETFEEVGIDLTKHALRCGNLPQRLVTTHWGKKPLLVLCPFVFLLTSHDTLPALKLQPTEVASTHWVPITSLRDPERRTVVFEDVSARLASQETGVKRWILASLLGKMVFAAISLEPTESLHSRIEIDGSVVDNRFARPAQQSALSALAKRMWNAEFFAKSYSGTPRQEGPLLLWGLTLGVISDFLDLVPPKGGALEMWTYPTFTPLDVRFAIWLLTLRFKNRKRIELQSGVEFRDSGASFGATGESVRVTGMDGSTECLVPTDQGSRERADETGFHGLGTGLRKGKYKATITTLLEGWVPLAESVLPKCTDRSRYYELVRRAVLVAFMGRLGVGAFVGLLVWRWGKRRDLVRAGVPGLAAVGG